MEARTDEPSDASKQKKMGMVGKRSIVMMGEFPKAAQMLGISKHEVAALTRLQNAESDDDKSRNDQSEDTEEEPNAKRQDTTHTSDPSSKRPFQTISSDQKTQEDDARRACEKALDVLGVSDGDVDQVLQNPDELPATSNFNGPGRRTLEMMKERPKINQMLGLVDTDVTKRNPMAIKGNQRKTEAEILQKSPKLRRILGVESNDFGEDDDLAAAFGEINADIRRTSQIEDRPSVLTHTAMSYEEALALQRRKSNLTSKPDIDTLGM